MTQQELLDEFFALPPEAQRQVRNFIAFLRQKSARTEPSPQTQDIDLVNHPFIGMWRDRQDLANSTAWVRYVKESEW
ncbi:MAG: DUF2281 domain-containing protein [Microcoleus sp. SU_5_3]|nr:DUF2281 domain-containing protein [Microcoleus sp. SU_5_3]